MTCSSSESQPQRVDIEISFSCGLVSVRSEDGAPRGSLLGPLSLTVQTGMRGDRFNLCNPLRQDRIHLMPLMEKALAVPVSDFFFLGSTN